MTILQLIFFAFAALLLFAAVMVIVSRQPVQSVLFLVLCFFASSVLWMLLQAEFLALALIFVYIGAVMTLFLFVVMMLNLDLAPMQSGFVKFLPFGIMVLALLLGLMLIGIFQSHLGPGQYPFPTEPADYSNVKQLGLILYTDYFYPFEIAAVLLLVAIIAAIALAFRRQKRGKNQRIAEQVAVTAKDRIRLVK